MSWNALPLTRMAMLALLAMAGTCTPLPASATSWPGPRSPGGLSLGLLAAPAWDSNAAQEDGLGSVPAGDGLGLLLGRAELQGRPGRNLGFDTTLVGGAKRFFAEREEDSLILQYSAQLACGLPGPFSLLAGLSAKDRSQPGDRRSYRSGDLAAGLSLQGPGGWVFSARGLLLGFRCLPDADYDHTGWGAELHSRWLGTGLRLQSSLRMLGLAFSGVRVRKDGRLDPQRIKRSDLLYRIDLEAAEIGAVVAEQGLFLQLAESTSAGSSHVRLGGRGSLSVSLPWELDLSCRATLLWARYDRTAVPPDVADPTFGVEDEETRSSLGLGLRRPLAGGLALEARWSRYFTLVTGPTYRRDVFLLGVRYAAEL